MFILQNLLGTTNPENFSSIGQILKIYFLKGKNNSFWENELYTRGNRISQIKTTTLTLEFRDKLNLDKYTQRKIGVDTHFFMIISLGFSEKEKNDICSKISLEFSFKTLKLNDIW